MTSESPRRGRPVDPDIEARVIAATLEIYGAVGWAGFTIDAVARTSRVGKAAIYRRWAHKQELIAAAIGSLRGAEGFEVTGHLKDDLTHVAQLLVRRYTGPYGLVYVRALVEAKVFPEVLGSELAALQQTTSAGGRRIVSAAIDSGELPDGVVPALMWDALAGTIVHRVLMLPPDRLADLRDDPEPFVARVVAFVLSGISWDEPAIGAGKGSSS